MRLLEFMVTNVFTIAVENFKIFNSVVNGIVINVMNNLVFFKKSVKMFFHNKSMFIDISPFIAKGMAFVKNCYISIRFSFSSIFSSFISNRSSATYRAESTVSNFNFTRNGFEFLPTLKTIFYNRHFYLRIEKAVFGLLKDSQKYVDHPTSCHVFKYNRLMNPLTRIL